MKQYHTNWYPGKKFYKKRRLKTYVLLENYQLITHCLVKRKKKHIYIYKCVCVCVFTINPSTRTACDVRSFLKRDLTGLSSEFYFSYTGCQNKVKEPTLPYYFHLTGGRIVGFIPFPRVLVVWEMQTSFSRIWTRVIVSISYNDIHYITSASVCVCVCVSYTRINKT